MKLEANHVSGSSSGYVKYTLTALVFKYIGNIKFTA